VAAATARAQDARLAQRLDKPTYVAVNAIVDSARVAKLPTAPLVDKALEGAAKGSDGQKIVFAVHQLSVRMTSARHVLGATSSPDEIKAAATALDNGVSDRDLARVKSAGGKRPVTMPLAVLTDLIGRQVPIATATSLVVQLAQVGHQGSGSRALSAQRARGHRPRRGSHRCRHDTRPRARRSR
jgi:hypothetical protein